LAARTSNLSDDEKAALIQELHDNIEVRIPAKRPKKRSPSKDHISAEFPRASIQGERRNSPLKIDEAQIRLLHRLVDSMTAQEGEKRAPPEIGVLIKVRKDTVLVLNIPLLG